MHYNDPHRFSAPWIDAGKHQTRTAGLRRFWLHPPTAETPYWTCSIAGEGSTCGDTREAAIESAKRW
jgi:hypothetical protein